MNSGVQYLPKLQFINIALSITIALAILFYGTAEAEEQTVNQAEINEYYEKALISFEEQDYRATMIHLKNTFQKQKEHLAGRILYAKILLAHDNGVAAEVELDYANQLGADLNVIRPLKANALLLQQQFNKVLEITLPGKYSPAIEIEMAYLRGQAFIGLKKFVFAEESFDYALKVKPNHNLSNLGKAQVFIFRKEFALAAQYTEKALHGYNVPESARLIRAKLYLVAGDYDAAIEQLNKAIKLNPDYLAARMVKAEVLLSQGNAASAEADIDYILDRVPKEPQTNYLKMIAATKQGDRGAVAETFANILATLNALPDDIREENPQYLYLAGYILYKQGNLIEASSYFENYLKRVNDERGIVMLAEVELALQDFISAKNLLIKGNRNFPNNEAILNLLARSFMGLEQYDDAQRYLIESLQLNPNNPSVVLLLAESFIAQKNYNKAVAVLLKIEQAFPNTVQTLLALNTSFNHLNNREEASARTQKLITIAPNNAYFYFIHGKNFLANKQLSNAEGSFNKAIALSVDYIAPKVALAELLVIQGNTDKAKAELEALLIQHPKEVLIMQSLASLHKSLKQYEESTFWLEKVLAEDIDNIEAFVSLEHVYRRTGQLDKIQNKLEDALHKKSIGKLHELLGGIYLSKREYAKAINQFEIYVTVADNRGYALSVLANAQVTGKDINSAISSLRKSLVWDDEIVSTHILLTKLLMANNEISQAKEQISIIRAKDKIGVIAELLEGDLLYKQGQYRKALSYYQKAFAFNQSKASTLALYRTFKKLNQLKEAEQLLTTQLDKSKDLDLKLVIALADIYQLQQQNTKASNLYKKALESYPKSPALLNNLANSLIEEGKAEEASVYTQRALLISPNNVSILDTFAWGQIHLANFEVALTTLRKALAIDAENNSVKYHLAIALDNLNRRKAAQSYLIQVVESPRPFHKKKAAKELLDSWL